MDEKIDPGLFARLMRLSPTTRKDLLEYLGQGPVSPRGMLEPLQHPTALHEGRGQKNPQKGQRP